MTMLSEVQFSEARRSLTDIFDGVYHHLAPAIVRRRQAEDVLLLRRDLQRELLRAYALKPEVLQEEDGSVTLALDALDLFVNAPDAEAAVSELVRELKTYAEDYRDRMPLFLNAPNRREHFPYVMRVWLCDGDAEIRALLEI